jgi:Flp pilus assembly protein TadG
MGDSAATSSLRALEASSVTIDFLNDTAAANVLATLAGCLGYFSNSSTSSDKGTSAATSATNPLYTMTCLVNNTTDINGAVGDLGTQSVTWTVNGTVVITTS